MSQELNEVDFYEGGDLPDQVAEELHEEKEQQKIPEGYLPVAKLQEMLAKYAEILKMMS